MATIADLEVLVLDRLEDQGVFWSTKNEIRPLLAEAMVEATLISGLPQVRSRIPFTLTANTRLFTLPYPGFVLARMDGQSVVEKTSFWALDQDNFEWEEDGGSFLMGSPYGIGPYGIGPYGGSIGNNDGLGDEPLKWFPFGIGQFGIYPLLTADVEVFLTTINLPVTVPRPYTGAEPVPFSVGFQEALVDSAAAIARLKEGGVDFTQGLKFYESFLSRMTELSKYGDRISKLRFTRSVGVPAQGSDTQVR